MNCHHTNSSASGQMKPGSTSLPRKCLTHPILNTFHPGGGSAPFLFRADNPDQSHFRGLVVHDFGTDIFVRFVWRTALTARSRDNSILPSGDLSSFDPPPYRMKEIFIGLSIGQICGVKRIAFALSCHGSLAHAGAGSTLGSIICDDFAIVLVVRKSFRSQSVIDKIVS